MKVISQRDLHTALAALSAGEPRVVASGNLGTPRVLLDALEGAVERYRLFMLAAQAPLPAREGVIFETPFVGPGMRDTGERLDYLPMRLSLVPRLFSTLRPPDVVLLHTSMPHKGKVSLGIEVNILPAAVEHVRARGGLVIAQLNSDMPYTLGDGELAEDLIDLAVEVQQDLPTRPSAPTTTMRRRSPSASPISWETAPPCSSGSARSPMRRCAHSSADATWGSGRR